MRASDLLLPLLLLSAVMTAEEPAVRLPPPMPADCPHHQVMQTMPPTWVGSEQIAMVVYPGMTALDLTGPQYMFAGLMGAQVHLVAESLIPVMTDTGVIITPTKTFETCPRDLDILFVPGGSRGTVEAAKDPRVLTFLRDRGSRAKLVTSVCTGSLVLGAAGLLDGYQATSHWVTRDLLTRFGAVPIDARVVVDRNRITGAGVSAGIDLGLLIVRRLRDEEYAKAMCLLAEYAPEPPVVAGTPAQAGPVTTKIMSDMCVGLREAFLTVPVPSRP